MRLESQAIVGLWGCEEAQAYGLDYIHAEKVCGVDLISDLSLHNKKDEELQCRYNVQVMGNYFS